MSPLTVLQDTRLATLLEQVARDPGTAALHKRLSDTPRGTPLRFSVLDAAKPAVLAALADSTTRPTMLLVNRLGRARQLAEEMTTWLGDGRRVYVFPELDALPYERLIPGPEHLYDRLRAMLALGSGLGRRAQDASARGDESQPPEGSAPSPVVIVTARAIMDRLMAPEACRASTWQISVGERIRPEQLIARWVQAGYEPVAVVERPGEFARRGGIIDIYPCGGAADFEPVNGSTMPASDIVDSHAQSAYRIELWGNDVDSIRSLDPGSQRSVASVRTLTIGPAHEVLPDQSLVATNPLANLELNHLQAQVRDAIENELRMLGEGQTFSQIDWYRGVLGTASILDYLPEGGVLVIDEPGSIAATTRELQRQAEQLSVDLLERGEAPAATYPRPYWSWEELEPRLGRLEAQRLDLVLDPDALDTTFVHAPTYSGRLPDLFRDAGRDNNERLVIISQQAARLADLMAEQGVAYELSDGSARRI